MASAREVRTFLKAGLPFATLCILGAGGLSVFLQGKNDSRKLYGARTMTEKEFDLQEEHRKMSEKLQLNDYKIIRVPKPAGAASGHGGGAGATANDDPAAARAKMGSQEAWRLKMREQRRQAKDQQEQLQQAEQ